MSVRGITLEIVFHENVYEIKGLGIVKPINKLYDYFLEQEEIRKIVNDLGNWQYGILEDELNKLGN